LGFSQLAGRPAVLAQGVGRRVLERDSVSFVPKLLQIAHERAEPIRILTNCVQNAPRTRVESTRVFHIG
jgi:hypothetical protein